MFDSSSTQYSNWNSFAPWFSVESKASLNSIGDFEAESWLLNDIASNDDEESDITDIGKSADSGAEGTK